MLPKSRTMPTGITDNVKELMTVAATLPTIDLLKPKLGARNLALASLDVPHFTAEEVAALKSRGVSALLFVGDGERPGPDFPFPVYDKSNGHELIARCDLIVIYTHWYWNVYQQIGVTGSLRDAAMRKDIPIVPYAANAWRYPLLPAEYLEGADVADLRFNFPVWQYITRSNLRGSYAEFGTFYGRSFFRTYLYFNEHIDGDFWSFDSFGGLPPSRPEESFYTKRDFEAGRYFCNEASFRAIGQMLFPNDPRVNSRIKIVKGYYSESLDGKTIHDYGMKEKSISYCCIDCDLFDSTLSVLRFIEPALDDGAVIYFDDYRTSRAAPNASEYHAVKVWLKENPTLDLLDLHQDFWPNQYVIFNRRWG